MEQERTIGRYQATFRFKADPVHFPTAPTAHSNADRSVCMMAFEVDGQLQLQVFVELVTREHGSRVAAKRARTFHERLLLAAGGDLTQGERPFLMHEAFETTSDEPEATTKTEHAAHIAAGAVIVLPPKHLSRVSSPRCSRRPIYERVRPGHRGPAI
jgi:hypothetical protein